VATAPNIHADIGGEPTFLRVNRVQSARKWSFTWRLVENGREARQRSR